MLSTSSLPTFSSTHRSLAFIPITLTYYLFQGQKCMCLWLCTLRSSSIFSNAVYSQKRLWHLWVAHPSFSCHPFLETSTFLWTEAQFSCLLFQQYFLGCRVPEWLMSTIYQICIPGLSQSSEMRTELYTWPQQSYLLENGLFWSNLKLSHLIVTGCTWIFK